ncbi:stromal cell-derived factor 2-like protein [Pseudoscourfieldia marina]
MPGTALMLFPFLALLFMGAASSEASEVIVTCGSSVKLQHDRTKYRLHSHEVQYGSGSGQQSVTGYKDGDDSNDYWIVHGAFRTNCTQGTPIESGTVVRLRHVNTGKWLHSHLHRSPISGNLEVSAYDGGTVEGSDSGDNWEVNLDAGGKWKRDQRVRFKHVDTQHWLHSHDKRFGRPIAGQQEICAVQKKTNDALWFAGEGVYFPEREKPSAYLKTPHEDL